MNSPPVFTLVSADAAASAALTKASGIVSLFPDGQAPQQPEAPYAVWQVVSGVPDIVLSGQPPVSRVGVQIDVYAIDAAQARGIADAVHCAISGSAHRTRFDDGRIEAETGLHRYSMDYDFFEQ